MKVNEGKEQSVMLGQNKVGRFVKLLSGMAPVTVNSVDDSVQTNAKP